MLTLLAIVLLVYLFQCMCWSPARAHVFSLSDPQRGHWKKDGFLWGALELRGNWANPLPPLQPLTVVDWPTFQLTPEAVHAGSASSFGEPVLWERAVFSRVEGKLLCNDVKVFEGGADQCKAYLEMLSRLQQAKVKDRKKLIEGWLLKATDADAAQERLESFSHKAIWMELAANLQFCVLFTTTPLAFYRFGGKALWPTLATVLAISIFITWQFWRLHRKFFPADSDARFKSLFSILLSPINAIRASDLLARDLFAGFHPVAVAQVVCRREEFESLAAEQLRAIKFSHSGSGGYADQVQHSLEALLQKAGLEPKSLLEAPQREDNCVSYCPRCLAQYTKTREDCADCGFSPLNAFPEEQEVATS